MQHFRARIQHLPETGEQLIQVSSGGARERWYKQVWVMDIRVKLISVLAVTEGLAMPCGKIATA